MTNSMKSARRSLGNDDEMLFGGSAAVAGFLTREEPHRSSKAELSRKGKPPMRKGSPEVGCPSGLPES